MLFGMLIIWFGGQQIHILPEKKYTSKLSYTAFCREINVVWYSEFSADENSVIVSSLYGLCFTFLPQHHKSPRKTKPFKIIDHRSSI